MAISFYFGLIGEGMSFVRDLKDKITADIFTGSKPVGRPRVHANNALKQKLYRERKKNLKLNLPLEASK